MKVIKFKSGYIFIILFGLWNITTSTFQPETIASDYCQFSFDEERIVQYYNPQIYQSHNYKQYISPEIRCVLDQDDEIIEFELPNDSKLPNGSYPLVDVILEGSNINTLKSTIFYNIKEMRKLNMASCNITLIADNTFYKLNYLTELNLNKNNIKSVTSQIFSKLLNLIILQMNHNNLSSFDVTLIATTFLDLSFNEIHHVNITCDNLLILNLTNNNMEDLFQSNFDNISNLQRLYLNNNNISSISGGIFHKMTHLLRLDLSGNNINSILLSSFLGLDNLIELILDNNKLSYIDIHAFHDLQSLRELSLVGNLISTLDTKLFAKSTLVQLRTVSLNNNPWDCNNLLDIVQLSKQRENTVIINKGADRTNSSIMGIPCVKIENINNRVVSTNNDKFDSDILFQVVNKITSKLDKIIEELNVTKINDDTNFSQFLNKGFQNTEFARFFTGNFRNLAFFKYFEKQVINSTLNSVLSQAKSINDNNSSFNAIIDNLTDLIKQFNSSCVSNNSQDYVNAEKLISPDTSTSHKTDNLILGLLCFLTIIVISMLCGTILYFYKGSLFQAKEKLVNYKKGDSQRSVTIEELECL